MESRLVIRAVQSMIVKTRWSDSIIGTAMSTLIWQGSAASHRATAHPLVAMQLAIWTAIALKRLNDKR